MELLLEAGCYLGVEVARDVLEMGSCASLRATRVLLGHLKMWRGKLTSLMLEHIPHIELQQPESHSPSVLDAKVYEVITTLEREGVFPFKIFGLQPGDYRLGDQSDGTRSRSIYHLIRVVQPAVIAFELGFQDIDEYFNGWTPLMAAAAQGNLWQNYSLWLIAHGATTYTNILTYKHMAVGDFNSQTQHTVAHKILKGLGRLFKRHIQFAERKRRMKDSARDPEVWVECLLGKVSIKDGCECSCSTFYNGCLPITTFINSIYGGIGDIIIRIYDDIFDLVANDDSSNILTKAILQALTFNFLGFRHTCCINFPDNPKPNGLQSYAKDHAKIWDDDHVIRYNLDELVAEFMDQFTSQTCSLSEFIKQHWYPRMEKVKQEFESPTLTQERDPIQAPGVQLEDDIADDAESENAGYRDKSTPQYYIQKLDKIWSGSAN